MPSRRCCGWWRRADGVNGLVSAPPGQKVVHVGVLRLPPRIVSAFTMSFLGFQNLSPVVDRKIGSVVQDAIAERFDVVGVVQVEPA